MNKIFKISFIGAFCLIPTLAFAAFEGVKELIEGIGELIALLIPIVAGIALLLFFWGLAKFIFKASDPKAREEGRSVMIWGIIALFVMISVWGIVFFIQDQLDLPLDNSVELPEEPNVDWPPPQEA